MALFIVEVDVEVGLQSVEVDVEFCVGDEEVVVDLFEEGGFKGIDF